MDVDVCGMTDNGRKKQVTREGGVALHYRDGKGFRVEVVDVRTSAVSEDVLAGRVECMNSKGKPERLIVTFVYTTVDSERAMREKRGKYDVLRKVVRVCHKVIVVGDMNGHVGVLGERMHRNGELVDEFVDKIDLENLNVTLAGGRVTRSAGDQESAIDYLLVNGRMRVCVTLVDR